MPHIMVGMDLCKDRAKVPSVNVFLFIFDRKSFEENSRFSFLCVCAFVSFDGDATKMKRWT